MSDIGASLAVAVLPFVRVAGQPFQLGFGLANRGEDGSPEPQDVSGVTDARITLQLRVARGVTRPAATVYTLEGGEVTLGTSLIDGTPFPVLVMSEAAGLDAGVYDLTVTLTNHGNGDPVMVGTVALIDQP